MSHVIIGHNIYRGKTTPIPFREPDRLRHMYMIGKTGVGKSTVFENMVLQDIRNHHGACFIDPHGESIERIISQIPANRLEDVVLFDPANTVSPLGLNLLEAHDEQEKDFLVAEIITIFYKLFDPEKTGIIGPQFEHWLRNAALTVMAGPEGGSIIEIPKLFVDRRFEAKKRQHLRDPLVLEFWSKQMAHTAEFHKSEMLNYFTSKFGHFLNNALMRNIIGQRRSAIDFGQIIAREKILLVNLSKGRIGELNAQMLGLIVVAKLQLAILKRAAVPANERPAFYLYVDEFQNLLTDTFVSLLSESRKYGLGVHLTNQYLAQLPEKIKDAVLGNVGTLLAFEVGSEDADLLARQFNPMTRNDFLNLERFNFYLKLMIDGKTSEAFSGMALPPLTLEQTVASDKVRAVSQVAYGRPRLLVEAEIREQLR